MRDATLSQLNFESVFRLRISIAKRCIGSVTERGDVGGAMKQSRFGFARAPWFCTDSAECDADEGELAV